MRSVNEVDSDIESISAVHAVNTGGHHIYCEINIKDVHVMIQIDIGATTNVIPEEVHTRQSRDTYLHCLTKCGTKQGFFQSEKQNLRYKTLLIIDKLLRPYYVVKRCNA